MGPNKTVGSPAHVHEHPGAVLTEMATFIDTLRLETLPPQIVERARVCLFYGLGIATLCLSEQYGRLIEEALNCLEGGPPSKGGATVWRSGQRMSVGAAAACNTVLMHSRCQEDTFGSAHIGIVAIPTVIALVEAGHADASRILEALVAGYETAGALERRLGRMSTAAGFRNSPLYGTVAGAATAAKLLGLDVRQTSAALANAAAFTGGIRRALDNGTDEWRYQPGVATRRGLEAAFIARTGIRTSESAYDGAGGFASAFCRTTIESPLDLGKQWNLPDVQFKPYPVCNRNQTPTALAARLHHEFDTTKVRRVRIRISSFVSHGMLNRGPFGAVGETLMSTYFACAAALAYGTVTRSVLQGYADPAIRYWIDRLDIEADDTVTYPSALAEVETEDGACHLFTEHRTPASYALPRTDVRALLSRLMREEGVEDSTLQAIEIFAYTPGHSSLARLLAAFAQPRLSAADKAVKNPLLI